MLAVNPYPRVQAQPRDSVASKDTDGTECTTSASSEHTSTSYHADDDESMDQPLLKALSCSSNHGSDDEDSEQPSPTKASTPSKAASPSKSKRPSVKRSGSERSRARSKSRERPQRTKSGQGVRRSTSGQGVGMMRRNDAAQSEGGEKENTTAPPAPAGRRMGLFKSLSFSDRTGMRGLKKTSSFSERQKRGSQQTGSDADNDSKHKRKEATKSARPGMQKRSNSFRDMSSRSGFELDGDDKKRSESSGTSNQRENLDKIQHLEAKTELYKEEFKRVVQEKKQILSSYVAETAELTEEITMIRKLLFASEEENRKLKAALHEAGIQPSILAALTETDGLPRTTFDELTSALSSATKNGLSNPPPSRQDQPMSPKKALENSCHIAKGPNVLLTQVYRPRPSLFQLPGLRTLPFWTQSSGPQTEVAYQEPSLTWAVQHLEKNWEKIMKEYKRVAPSMSAETFSYKVNANSKIPTPEHFMQKGKCSLRTYMKQGKIQSEFKETFVRTTALLQAIQEKGILFEGIPFGSVYFSNLKPKSRVATHSSAMNLRLRLHLPIILPDESSGGGGKKRSGSIDSSSSLPPLNSYMDSPRPVSATKKLSTLSNASDGCGVRVGALQRKYELGKALLLDDSYDHESWNDSDNDRVVLVVDLWHPDVTPQERMAIVAHTNKHEQNGSTTGDEECEPDESTSTSS